MINISWSKLNEIASVISRLSADPKADPVASYRAARVFAVGKREVGKIQEAQEVIFKKYQEQDGDKTKLDDKGEPIWNAPDAAENCYKEVKALMDDTKVDIKINKFEYAHIKHLTGQELMVIEEFVDGIPDVV